MQQKRKRIHAGVGMVIVLVIRLVLEFSCMLSTQGAYQ
jgi:hypothetical protein